jgi:hypothetical protein
MNPATHTKVVRAGLASPVLLPMQQTLQIHRRDVGSRIPSIGLVSASKNSSQSLITLHRKSRPLRSRRDAVCSDSTALFASSEFELKTDLPFAPGQPLGNRAEQVSRALLNLYGMSELSKALLRW